MAESRRTVTVVFCDIVGSTALGERLDPEAVRHVLQRYFDEARAALEQHGGSVEKFIGDAVMAVFGIPQLHEDDALRAVRAAAELKRRVAALNEELARDRDATIAVRIGVNSGEVVAADTATGQQFVTGDAVNVAARLEQAAGPGEILIGDTTRRLLPDAIRVEGMAQLEVKGKAKPVPAWRLVDVPADVPGFARRIDAPFVGRESELGVLRDAFRQAAAGTCRLVTVLAPPGLGKSRLARELTARSTAAHASPSAVASRTERALPTCRSARSWVRSPGTTRAGWLAPRAPRRVRSSSSSASPARWAGARLRGSRRRSRGPCGGSSRPSPASGRLSSSSTTSTGRRPPFST